MEQHEQVEWRLILKKMAGELTGEEEASFRAWREADEERGRYVERATRAWEQAGTGDEADVERAIARFDQARRVEDIGSRASPRRVTGLMGWERKKPLVKESLTSG